MPIPKPKSTETQSEFMKRCVGEIIDEYGRVQAVAICLKQWGGDYEKVEPKKDNANGK